MSVEEIEREFDCSFEEIVRDFCFTPNYMGYTFTVCGFASMFNMKPHTLVKLARERKIPLPKKRFKFIDRIDDICWVKFGVTLEQYLRSRSLYLSIEEMSVQLECPAFTVGHLLRKYGLVNRNIFYRYKI